jgi:hypothetical protein
VAEIDAEVLERVAESGAAKALARLGLHDEHAERDIRELRTLLESWRAVRRDVRDTVVKTITKVLTGAVIAAIGLYILHR